MGRERALGANGIYWKGVSDTALSTDPSIDYIWMKIITREVKAAYAAPVYLDLQNYTPQPVNVYVSQL